MTTKVKAKPKTKTAKVAKPIPGLYGKGLVRLGDESRLELRERLQMPRVVFGRVVNVSERTIAKVEAAAEPVDKLCRPYNEVFRLSEALSEVVEPKSLGTWFTVPNQAFDGLKPIEVIERGEIDRLWNMIYYLESGVAS